MLSRYTDYLATMPEITIYANCDTCLAVNLRAFDIGDNDEFIFTLKNYDYIESDFIYMFKARNTDIDENGEVLFKIPAKTSKMLKPGAFYNFAVLTDAYDRKLPTVYKRLTENGNILIECGTQDMLVKTGTGSECTEEIVAARLATLDTIIEPNNDPHAGELLSGYLEIIEEA